ncbi:hypothetical protein L195_g022308, partial [Trifolium pratense]
VKKIPETFKSPEDYKEAFIPLLLEETHTDLSSSLLGVARAPFCEILKLKRDSKLFKLPKPLFYKIQFKKNVGKYEPEFGDLILFTDIRPKSVDDLKLNTANSPYHIAFVYGPTPKTDEIQKVQVLSSKCINTDFESNTRDNETQKLYAVYLMNMIGENCQICLSETNSHASFIKEDAIICSQKLNESQEDSVLSSVDMTNCHHSNVKLIWGPPGTGKTKTVAIRLHSLVMDSLEHDTYGLGDIVLFGNKTGWKKTLELMKKLLRDPQEEYLLEICAYRAYRAYMQNIGNEAWKDIAGSNLMVEHDIKKSIMPMEQFEDQIFMEMSIKKKKFMELREQLKLCTQTLFERFTELFKGHREQHLLEKGDLSGEDVNDYPTTFEGFLQKAWKEIAQTYQLDDDDENACVLTMEQFVKQRFVYLRDVLEFLNHALYTHLPKSFVSLETVKVMLQARSLFESFENDFSHAKFKQTLYNFEEQYVSDCFGTLCDKRDEILSTLNSLSSSISLPSIYKRCEIEKFCLSKSCLILCTASSSGKLYTEGMTRVEFLVIDEAAQLKECESTIPLQLPGLSHCILIGDERQLPALVKSKIADKCEFGRSMFERLVMLGFKRKMLNVQYRMHPSISLFPCKEFYEEKLSDAAIVMGESYNKSFLEGEMYSSYSFINIAEGKEKSGRGHSLKNMVEVAVISEIIQSLKRGYNFFLMFVV